MHIFRVFHRVIWLCNGAGWAVEPSCKSLSGWCAVPEILEPFNLGEDGLGGGSPHQRRGIGVVVLNKALDLRHQRFDAGEGSAPNRLLGDDAEPALDLVELSDGAKKTCTGRVEQAQRFHLLQQLPVHVVFAPSLSGKG